MRLGNRTFVVYVCCSVLLQYEILMVSINVFLIHPWIFFSGSDSKRDFWIITTERNSFVNIYVDDNAHSVMLLSPYAYVEVGTLTIKDILTFL